MDSRLVMLGAVTTALSAPIAAEASTCTYTLTEAKPGWTAYKTTQKLAVAGTFKDFKLTAGGAADSVPNAISGASLSIVPSSVDSGLEVRNQTIATKYFAVFAPDAPFEVRVASVDGDNTSGTANLTIDINGTQKTLAFPYTVTDDGQLSAKATMEMMDFGLKTAFDSIHKACEVLHIGPDGISKTWTDVELSVTAKLTKTCQ